MGIVNLIGMHESDAHVFIVMGRMDDDLLEYTMSAKKSRLPEHVVKYLSYQIIVALKYLHAKNIVHCDLKPENVLLKTNKKHPELLICKLCDFGYARIIGENTFRSTMLGTPAYRICFFLFH